MLIMAAIETNENWDVAVINLPGFYSHADMDDLVIMVMRGKLGELMAEAVSEIYQNYVTYHNGKAVLYVTLQKALYECLKSALVLLPLLIKNEAIYS